MKSSSQARNGPYFHRAALILPGLTGTPGRIHQPWPVHSHFLRLKTIKRTAARTRMVSVEAIAPAPVPKPG